MNAFIKQPTYPVDTTIHPNDNMHPSGSEQYYMPLGKSGLENVQKAVAESGLKQVNKILDLPSGHGRVARWLRYGYPDAEITFCDTDPEGAEFCAKQFRGTALVSKSELTDLELPDRYDAIWIGSLFTHFDLQTTTRWLRHLCASLNENGVLVASFHGRYSIAMHNHSPFLEEKLWAQVMDGYNLAGFGYAAYPGAEIGVSLSKASKVVEIAESIEGVRLIGYKERGWAGNHDVLSVAKTPILS